MAILVILAHPNKQSFNTAIAQTVVQQLRELGHKVFFHDLYAEEFDPLLYQDEFPKDIPLPPLIQQHCTQLAHADGIVIVHPNWWGQPPAILKGWVDRVIRPGVAYRFIEGDSGQGVPAGLLKAHTAVVINTSNTSQERECSVFGDPLEHIWKDCIFGLCGVKHFYRTMFRTIVTSTPEERRQWLEEVKKIVHNFFPT